MECKVVLLWKSVPSLLLKHGLEVGTYLEMHTLIFSRNVSLNPTYLDLSSRINDLLLGNIISTERRIRIILKLW